VMGEEVRQSPDNISAVPGRLLCMGADDGAQYNVVYAGVDFVGVVGGHGWWPV
jgi:hypothetical protein